MRRYIKADLRRIFRRVPRWIMLGISWIVMVVLSVTDVESFPDAIGGLMSDFLLFNIVFGLIEIIYIYGDDFKAKTMQMAIGTGLARQKVVHAKWIEFMITTAIDLVVPTILGVAVAAAAKGTKGGMDVGKLLIELFVAWLMINAYLGSVMFFMYWMQGISLTLILFILDGCGMFTTALKMIGTAAKLTRFHLQTYSLSSLLGTFEARLVMGNFSWSSFIGIVIYLVIGFVLASVIFKKKELEF